MKVMISQGALGQQPDWKKALGELVTDPLELLSLLEISPQEIPWAWNKHFPVRVSKSFIQRMQKGDPHDPLLRQVLSQQNESQLSSGCSNDPLLERNFNPLPGLLHKFQNRILLTFTANCAIHCRYCFRRHFPYAENNPGRPGWSAILNYIAERPEIIEVILSGGDPLLALDENLKAFLQQLAAITHVRLLRFHTRLPVVIPERITPTFIQALPSERFNISMVYHINHAAEIIPDITHGVTLLKQNNITVLNQAVLLKGINDKAECLKQLSLDLFAAGILPYYVHLLDEVQGAQHFSVDLSRAKELQAYLRENLPGYLVPRFVKEIPYKLNKEPLDLL